MAPDERARRGAHLEGAAVGPHVAHGCVGAGEHVRRPPHAGKGGADDTGQTLDGVERCSPRSCRRRDGERHLERAPAAAARQPAWAPRKAPNNEPTIGAKRRRASATGDSL